MAATENGTPIEKKRLTDLRVVDLRAELEKRGLDKTGVKANLMDRLSAALLAEKQDPNEYLFDVVDGGKVGKKSKTESDAPDGEDQEPMEVNDSKEAEEDLEDLDTIDFTVEDDAEIQLEELAADKENGSVKSQEGEFKVPAPDAVEPQCPFTVEDTIQLHAAAHQNGDADNARKVSAVDGSDSVSMIVHPEDETPTERVADGSGSATLNSQSSVDSKNGSAEGATKTGAVGDAPTEKCGEEQKKAVEVEKSDATEPERKKAGGSQGKTEMEVDGDGVKSSGEKVEAKTTEDQSSGDKKESGPDTVKEADKSDDSAKKAAKSAGSNSGKSLWISNLSQATRATDLKTLFSKYGRVTAAKIVTSKGQGESKYFGMVSMSTADEAAKCVTNLHRTELKGKQIEIERKQQPERIAQKPGAASSSSGTTGDTKSPSKSEDKKGESEKKEGEPKSEEKKGESSKRKEDGHRSSTSRHGSNKDHRDRRSPPRRSRDDRRRISGTTLRRPIFHRQRPRPPVPLMNRRIGPPRRNIPPPPTTLRRNIPPLGPPRINQYEQIELERKRIELERQELIEKMKQKEMEHQNREEQLRLQRERERLKFEREKFEREKLELQQLKMSQQTAAAAYAFQAPTASLSSTRRSYDADTGAVQSGGYSSFTNSSSKSRERSRDRSSRRERSDYHLASSGNQRSSGGRGNHKQSRESTGSHRNSTGSYGRPANRSSGGAAASFSHGGRGRDSGAYGGGSSRGDRHQKGSSPRRSSREVTITTPFAGSTAGWNAGAAGGRGRSDFGMGARTAGAGAVLQTGGFQTGGLRSWTATPQDQHLAATVATGSAGWGRQGQGATQQVPALMGSADVVYASNASGTASYSNADRFDAYKYSSRRY